MRSSMLVVALATAVALGACKKTGEGEYEVKTPDVDVSMDSTTINTPSVGTTTDTINTPVVGTTKDTLIVDRPTAGTQKTEVKRPTVNP